MSAAGCSIRRSASADGPPYTDCGASAHGGHTRSCRVAERAVRTVIPVIVCDVGEYGRSDLLGGDLALLKQGMDNPGQDVGRLLVQATSPAQHRTPAGLSAPRRLCQSY